MASHLNHMFKNVFKEFETLTENPEVYLKPASDQNKSFKDVTKKVYDAIIQANPLTDLQSKSLPKLLVDGFDEEQVWQQIELQNKNAISHLENTSSRIDVKSLSLGLDTQENIDNGDDSFHDEVSIEGEDEAMDDEEQDLDNEESDDGEQDLDNENSDDEEDLDDDDSDEYIDMENPAKKVTTNKNLTGGKSKPSKAEKLSDQDLDNGESDDGEQDLDNENNDDEEDLDDDNSDEYNDMENPAKKATKNEKVTKGKSKPSNARKSYRTEVDDRFFKLSKLEQFLRLEDLKYERSRDENKNEDDSSNDEDIDLFDDIPSDDGDSEEESEQANGLQKSSKEFMYNDFFDAPESGDDSIANSKEPTDDEEDMDSDLNEENAELEEDSENETADTNLTQDKAALENNSNTKTPFQTQLDKTKEQIARFEQGLLDPAPWHLTGEVDASKRPTDGLLHMQTDFEVNARPVVIEDKPLCEKLEDMLKNTIKNKAYSDGERQYKTSNEIIAQKKEIILEQNKSSKSLAQEYEDMYLKQKHNPEEKENPKHIEIRKLRDSLFPELHALFSHIPKPSIPDIKIVSNLPAISVEEVAPTSVSDVTLLAPEEIKRRSGLVKGQTERESTDKKRERRKKKALQKLKFKKKEKELEENPASGRMKKKEKLEVLKKLKQNRNTKIASMDGKRVKSSKDFFSQLQETVNSHAKQMHLKKKNK